MQVAAQLSLRTVPHKYFSGTTVLVHLLQQSSVRCMTQNYSGLVKNRYRIHGPNRVPHLTLMCSSLEHNKIYYVTV
jgi:hypothetical protein